MVDRSHINGLMLAAAEGDRAAIDPLFHAVWPIAVAYAMRMVGDRTLAEDCAQTALTRMFGHLEGFDPARDALGWTLAHVMWECRTARKTRTRRGEVPEAPSTAVADGRSELEQRDLVRAALQTIEALEPRDIEVIAASLFDQRTEGATYRKRLERALARLRTAWRARHGAQ